MRTIVRIQHGSHLYGTNTPASDLDYKSVFVPNGRDVLLQRVPPVIGLKREKAPGEKNLPGESEEEAYSLQKFLQLVAQGQTVALDVLFASDEAMTLPPAAEWEEIRRNRHRLVSRKASTFVSYCRTQANKYGIKGSRVAVARIAAAVLDVAQTECGSDAKLYAIESAIIAMTANHPEHMAILDIPGAIDATGVQRTVRHWEVCNRKMPLTQRVGEAYGVMRRLVNEYGQRSLQAERNEGVDWKALSHAVRVGRQATELLSTGVVTFPRPEAEHLLRIKLGHLPYREVAEEIERLLIEVEEAASRSTLPESADLEWIDDFIVRVYGAAVR